MQLDGTVRSFLLYCEDAADIRLCVIYRATSARYARQYAQLANAYAGRARVEFVEQRRFRLDVLGTLVAPVISERTGVLHRWALALGAQLGLPRDWWGSGAPPSRVLFLVDDSLFVRGFRLRDFREALDGHTDALGFSLRLGANTTYFYMRAKAQAIPRCSWVSHQILKFDWTIAEGDFGYPLELSSSVYRVSDLVPLLRRFLFRNPNMLEGRMAKRASSFRKTRPQLLCYEQSVAFCNPINTVQSLKPTRAGARPEYSHERLAQMFEEGYRIHVEACMGFVPRACHQEVELHVEKR